MIVKTQSNVYDGAIFQEQLNVFSFELFSQKPPP